MMNSTAWHHSLPSALFVLSWGRRNVTHYANLSVKIRAADFNGVQNPCRKFTQPFISDIRISTESLNPLDLLGHSSRGGGPYVLSLFLVFANSHKFYIGSKVQKLALIFTLNSP